jgi:hypothetical protein
MDNYLKYPREKIEHMDRAFQVTGVTKENVEEFCTANMNAFNDIALDQDNVDYYSMGSQKDSVRVGNVLRTGANIIKRAQIEVRSDGMVRPEDAVWGKYLMTWEYDFLELVGFNPDFFPSNLYNLVIDNIRLSEIKRNPQEAYDRGLSHLF